MLCAYVIYSLTIVLVSNSYRSGVHWDLQHGANIVGSDATSVWDDHIGKKVW